MSFDLSLTLRAGGALDRGAIERWAKARGLAVKSAQLAYENARTGVYFTIAITPEALYPNINFNRPTYFGVEAFEVIGEACNALGLVASNPQADATPRPFDAATLLDSYAAGNTRAVQAIGGVGGPRGPVMARDAAMALWRYRRIKPDLAAELHAEVAEEFMVPDLLVVARGAHALRLAFIPRPTWYVLPPADVFAFQRDGATQIADGELVRAGLRGFFVPWTAHPELAITTELALFDRMADWDALLDTVPALCAPNELVKVALDGFVDA